MAFLFIFKMPLVTTDVNTFFTILPAVLLAWILIDLWGKTIDLFAYSTLGMNRKSLCHVGGVAIFATITLFLVMCIADPSSKNTNDDTAVDVPLMMT